MKITHTHTDTQTHAHTNTHIYIYIYIYIIFFCWPNGGKKVNILKWIGPQMNLLVGYLFFFKQMLLTFKDVFRKLMVDLSVSFGFYRGECFDRVVVLFDSRISAREYSVRVHWPRKNLVSADISLAFSFFSTREYVCLCLCGCSYRCVSGLLFAFFFHLLLFFFLNNL